MQVKTDASLVMSSEKSCSTGRILVLGLGNILLKDEGVGVHIAQMLQELALPHNVEVVDGGTASLDVLLLAPGIEKLVVIDALRAGKEAGTIYKARLKSEERDKLEQIFSSGSRISLHQVGLIDALAIAEKMNCSPKEIAIIGIEPKKIDCGLELTDDVKQKIPEIINTVLKEVEDAIHTK
jgi:hydrogenase maturation protease